MSTPNFGIPYVPEGTLDPAAGLNLALNVADVGIQTGVISLSLSSPPGSPADGDMYVVNPPGTGAWTDLDNYLVRYVEEGSFWQSYEPGTRVKLLVNQADGGLYTFTDESASGDWQLVTGTASTLSVEDESSSPLEIIAVTRIVIGDGLILTEESDGSARIQTSVVNIFPPVVTESATSRNALEADAGKYVRFTNASTKTYTFNSSSGFTIDQEFHGRNAGAGDLTIVEAGSMTINPPFGGTLVIPEHGTFTVKIVSTNQADLFGVTVESS